MNLSRQSIALELTTENKKTEKHMRLKHKENKDKHKKTCPS